MIFNKGDLVSVQIDVLLEDHMNMIGMLAYKARPEIYGVVRETGENGRSRVSWSMEKMFNLDKEELNVDYEYIGNTHLTLVKKNDDSDSNNDRYTDTFFTHDEEGWKEACWMPQCCHFCLGSPRSPKPPAIYSCRRMMFRTQMAMMQLYFDLGSTQNDHLSNKQKRYQCYKWYTTIVYGTLGMRNRRRVDGCIGQEIVSHFPNPAGEERVGFRAA